MVARGQKTQLVRRWPEKGFINQDLTDESSESAPDSLYLWVGHDGLFRVKLRKKASLKGKRERANDNKHFEMRNILVH
ncbi:hypothetical protein D4764_12G0004340 [Takifugu flavidus]|uniref:Uncharacterized protein n=1 Tax=Takifugu flavidus TaxID=433684 RepID=A0A5C6PB79_9TELE|nr:hypothetical protein D4764_12G0004340 [Takifugu flavidus]